MAKYYACYPRNFLNEYTIVVIDNYMDYKKLEDWEYEDYEKRTVDRIILKDIAKMRDSERDRRKYDRAFSGYCDPWHFKTIDEFIEEN